MASRVRLQAIVAAEAVAGKLSTSQKRRWFTPVMTDATPTTPAIMANSTRNPVAAFPMGKYIGEKCAGKSNRGPAKIILHSIHYHICKKNFTKKIP